MPFRVQTTSRLPQRPGKSGTTLRPGPEQAGERPCSVQHLGHPKGDVSPTPGHGATTSGLPGGAPKGRNPRAAAAGSGRGRGRAARTPFPGGRRVRAWLARPGDQAGGTTIFHPSRKPARSPVLPQSQRRRPQPVGSWEPSPQRRKQRPARALLHPPPSTRHPPGRPGLKEPEGPRGGTATSPADADASGDEALFSVRGEGGLSCFQPLLLPEPCVHAHDSLTRSVRHQERQKPPERSRAPAVHAERGLAWAQGASAAAGAQAARPQRPRGPRERRGPARGGSGNTLPRSEVQRGPGGRVPGHYSQSLR